MNLIDINRLMSAGGEAATFQGREHGASVSFFIVQFSPETGPKKHRHPYEEIFILLEGEIQAIVDDRLVTLQGGQIAIIPAHTWHEFKNHSDKLVRMVNIHPVPKMITEWA